MEPGTTQSALESSAAAAAATEITIGIPTFNHSATAAEITTAALEAIEQRFHGGIVIHADGGSTDGTVERVAEAARDGKVRQHSFPAAKLAVPYHGVPGKAGAYRAILEDALAHGAKVCVTLDPDLRGITPDWIVSLAQPVLERGYDFAAPFYARHKFDGALGSALVYPLLRVLYGRRLRQPLGGDFAFSPALANDLLSGPVLSDDASAGTDIAIVTRALSGGFRVCEARLGPKVPYTRDALLDISTVLVQVVGAVYQETERHAVLWQKIRGSVVMPAFGDARSAGVEPTPPDAHKMIEQFRLGSTNLHDVWGLVLPPATLLDLKRIARGPSDPFTFPDETWVRIVYDFALGYRLRVIHRDHLLRALTPLYLGWVASLVSQFRDASLEEVEGRIEKLCQVFESMKPYLISRWRWPDRFSP